MKRLLSVFLTVLLLFTCTSTAYAAGVPTVKVTTAGFGVWVESTPAPGTTLTAVILPNGVVVNVGVEKVYWHAPGYGTYSFTVEDSQGGRVIKTATITSDSGVIYCMSAHKDGRCDTWLEIKRNFIDAKVTAYTLADLPVVLEVPSAYLHPTTITSPGNSIQYYKLGKQGTELKFTSDGSLVVNAVSAAGDRTLWPIYFLFESSINIDRNGDGTPDINIDTTGNGVADTNVDTNGDGVPDLNIVDNWKPPAQDTTTNNNNNNTNNNNNNSSSTSGNKGNTNPNPNAPKPNPLEDNPASQSSAPSTRPSTPQAGAGPSTQEKHTNDTRVDVTVTPPKSSGVPTQEELREQYEAREQHRIETDRALGEELEATKTGSGVADDSAKTASGFNFGVTTAIPDAVQLTVQNSQEQLTSILVTQPLKNNRAVQITDKLTNTAVTFDPMLAGIPEEMRGLALGQIQQLIDYLEDNPSVTMDDLRNYIQSAQLTFLDAPLSTVETSTLPKSNPSTGSR